MELYKELPLDLQLKIFDIYEEERNNRIAIRKTELMKEFLLDEFNFYADTFSNGIEWDVNLFMFVRRWEEDHEGFTN
jgi:hypothetical protein